MNSIWGIEMNVGDLIEFDEDFYRLIKAMEVDIGSVGIIREAKDMFYRVQTGSVQDLWVSPADIKKINLDKYSK